MSNAEFVDVLAERYMTPLLIGLTGPSSSGKTVSALRIATGMQAVVGGDIYHIDTEAGRALRHSPLAGEEPNPKKLTFRFRHLPFLAPFGPLRYLSAIQHCAKKGAGVIIVDSMSHEHEGPGGVLEMHAEDEARLRGSSDAAKWSAWNRGKTQRRQLINGILQLQLCFIFCFRSKEKIKPARKKAGEKLPEGQSGMIEMGWMPIGGEEFIYELDPSLLLGPQSKGIPELLSGATDEQRKMFKIPFYFEDLFKKPTQLTEETGRAMALWSTGGQVLDAAQLRAKNAAAVEAHAAVARTEAPKPPTGPDQSEPCPLCKNNTPRCKKCNREQLFAPATIHSQFGPRPGRWYCPAKCTPQVTTIKATDWHAVLEGDAKAALALREPGSDDQAA